MRTAHNAFPRERSGLFILQRTAALLRDRERPCRSEVEVGRIPAAARTAFLLRQVHVNKSPGMLARSALLKQQRVRQKIRHVDSVRACTCSNEELTLKFPLRYSNSKLFYSPGPKPVFWVTSVKCQKKPKGEKAQRKVSPHSNRQGNGIIVIVDSDAVTGARQEEDKEEEVGCEDGLAGGRARCSKRVREFLKPGVRTART